MSKFKVGDKVVPFDEHDTALQMCNKSPNGIATIERVDPTECSSNGRCNTCREYMYSFVGVCGTWCGDIEDYLKIKPFVDKPKQFKLCYHD